MHYPIVNYEIENKAQSNSFNSFIISSYELQGNKSGISFL